MDHRFLGNTGLKVSPLCLGTMTFGRETSVEESFRIIDRFVDKGGNFIDTANVYSQGKSEDVVGQWLANQRRSDFVIATKVRFRMGKGSNEIGLSRKHVLESVDSSLRRMGTDYIDLYQVHCWDDATPLEETLNTLNGLVQCGKVRYIGASNFSGWQLQKAIDLTRQRGWENFISLQPQYNLLCRSTEWELIPVCRNEGLGIIPWSPLRGGWLSGQFHRGLSAPPAGTRIEKAEEAGWGERWSLYNNEHTWQVIDALLSVSEDTGKTPAQVAINWLLQTPGVTAPIIGVRTIEQLQDNLGATGWALEEHHMKCLNDASNLPLPYPYEMIAGNRRR